MNKLRYFLVKNAPALGFGAGITGLLTSAVLSFNAGWQSKEKVETLGQNASLKEKIELIWPLLIIPTMSVGLTGICFYISYKSLLTKNEALLQALQISQDFLTTYQAKVTENLGAKKEEKIKDQALLEQANSVPIPAEIVLAGDEFLTYDPLSGRYFKSSVEKIRRVVNDFNESLFTDMYKSVNELYYDLGLEQTETGNRLGWTVENFLKVRFAAKITDNGVPVLVLDFITKPKSI